ncbi:hypothetical protein D3C73_1452060 [compost metagenome]
MYAGNRQCQISIDLACIAQSEAIRDINNQFFIAEQLYGTAPDRYALVGHCRKDHNIVLPG